MDHWHHFARGRQAYSFARIVGKGPNGRQNHFDHQKRKQEGIDAHWSLGAPAIHFWITYIQPAFSSTHTAFLKGTSRRERERERERNDKHGHHPRSYLTKASPCSVTGNVTQPQSSGSLDQINRVRTRPRPHMHIGLPLLVSAPSSPGSGPVCSNSRDNPTLAQAG